jgi:hypothetical protein
MANPFIQWSVRRFLTQNALLSDLIPGAEYSYLRAADPYDLAPWAASKGGRPRLLVYICPPASIP